MTTIIIPIDDELAVVYETLNAEQKRQFQTEVEIVLQMLKPRDTSKLDRTIREIQQEAKEKGLTQELLDQLLTDNNE